MLKSCRNCKNYKIIDKYCFKFHINIIDCISASVCKEYVSKKYVQNKVKCNNCKNMNKYGYCFSKKVCIGEDDKTKERKCSKFIIKSKKRF